MEFPTRCFPFRRRLGVVEVTPLDGRRRLILVRRDAVEHLLLVGPTSELVIETGIAGGDPASFQHALETASPAQAIEQAIDHSGKETGQ